MFKNKNAYYEQIKMNDETPKIVTEVLNFIKNIGHSCCYIHPITKQIEWCHSDVCEG
jgi:hypothetical protein